MDRKTRPREIDHLPPGDVSEHRVQSPTSTAHEPTGSKAAVCHSCNLYHRAISRHRSGLGLATCVTLGATPWLDQGLMFVLGENIYDGHRASSFTSKNDLRPWISSGILLWTACTQHLSIRIGSN